MQGERAIDSPDASGAWWRAAAALAWVLGVAMQLQQPALWPGASYPLTLAAALGLLLAAMRLQRAAIARIGIGLALATAGFGYAGWRADVRLADALAPEWEGCDVEVVGVIDEMPQVAEDGDHFAFVVESVSALGMSARELRRVQSLDAAAGLPLTTQVAAAEDAAQRARASSDDADEDDADDASPAVPAPHAGDPVVPARVWLAWSRNQRDDRAVAASPAPLHAGQRWRLPVRLRRPHGAMNPDGFDAELWLFDQGLRATGTVRGNGQLLASSWAPIENARQWVRDRLMLSGGEDGDVAVTGALAALAVGDQAAIVGLGK
jgi:competence protein ComEC